MQQAAFAVTAAGSTLFELACLGVPQIVFTIADNQFPNATAVEDNGLGYSMGSMASFKIENFADRFIKLVRDPQQRAVIARKARETVMDLVLNV